MSAQIIRFPGGSLAQPASASTTPARTPTTATALPVVRAIRGGRRVPKKNRTEDDHTIMIARLAASYEKKAATLAQTKPGSDEHRMAQHMSGISHKLPSHNLRIFITPDDAVQGIWKLWRRVKIANLEWELCDERRAEAAFAGDDAARERWAKEQDIADVSRWKLYERLIRIPADKLQQVTSYKLDRQFPRGMGNLDWMRVHKPELAAIIDEEVQRLTAERGSRRKARGAKPAEGEV